MKKKTTPKHMEGEGGREGGRGEGRERENERERGAKIPGRRFLTGNHAGTS
jgi:hypothetical protein